MWQNWLSGKLDTCLWLKKLKGQVFDRLIEVHLLMMMIKKRRSKCKPDIHKHSQPIALSHEDPRDCTESLYSQTIRTIHVNVHKSFNINFSVKNVWDSVNLCKFFISHALFFLPWNFYGQKTAIITIACLFCMQS